MNSECPSLQRAVANYTKSIIIDLVQSYFHSFSYFAVYNEINTPYYCKTTQTHCLSEKFFGNS